jgi:hypothetical protein
VFVGTGMMLISREALRLGAEAHLNCDYEREIDGWPEEKCQEVRKQREERFNDTKIGGNGWWFRFRPAKSDKDELGEDIYFCWQMKRFAKIDTYVDTSVLPEHWGDYGYSIIDYISQREYAVAKAQAEGRYMPPELVPAPKKHDEYQITVVDG